MLGQCALTTEAGLSILKQVHLDYLSADADVITTNTFRTNRRALAGKSFSTLKLTMRAVATAKEAVAEFGKPTIVDGLFPCSATE